jgi:cytochrome c-type biogenesis protein CcmF
LKDRCCSGSGCLIIFSGVVAWLYRDRHNDTMPWVIMIFCIVSAFFLGVVGFLSNPFETISPIPPDGRGLNPLLEDANMMTHPPLLYTGFVGLTVPYAFAMAALIVGKLDEAWIVSTRRWTITAWFFLTAGNLVGAWWSYHVLGWGGYWAWDPVENAAFMPWLPATAFLHSIQVQERTAHAEGLELIVDHRRLQSDDFRHVSSPALEFFPRFTRFRPDPWGDFFSAFLP